VLALVAFGLTLTPSSAPDTARETQIGAAEILVVRSLPLRYHRTEGDRYDGAPSPAWHALIAAAIGGGVAVTPWFDLFDGALVAATWAVVTECAQASQRVGYENGNRPCPLDSRGWTEIVWGLGGAVGGWLIGRRIKAWIEAPPSPQHNPKEAPK